MPDLRVGPRRCAKSGCKGWAVRTGEYCAGHDVHSQALARAAIKLKKRGLQLPRLNSTANARRWLEVIGEAVASDQIKVGKGRELRLLAVAYLSSDASGQLADRLDELQERIEDLTDGETPEA